MSLYVLFVKTGYENNVIREITRFWNIEGNPFIPMYDAHFRKAGKIVVERRRCFPGYVFIESEIGGLDFYVSVRSLVWRSEHVVKFLRSGGGEIKQQFSLEESESNFLQKLLNSDRCVEMSKGFIEGSKVIISEGPLRGLEGSIKKVNRHKKEAFVEVKLMGDFRVARVGLEVIEVL